MFKQLFKRNQTNGINGNGYTNGNGRVNDNGSANGHGLNGTALAYPVNGNGVNGNGANKHLIDLHQVVKAYNTPVGDFIALNGIDLQIGKTDIPDFFHHFSFHHQQLFEFVFGLFRYVQHGAFLPGFLVSFLF